MTTASTPLDYQALSEQLDIVLGRLQTPDIQVDEAMKLYEEGLDIVTQLEQYLQKAENTLTRLKLQADEG